MAQPIIKVNSTDRTSQIEPWSFNFEQILTRQRDTFYFEYLRNINVDSWIPSVGDEVLIYDGTTKLFGGYITDIEKVQESVKTVRFKISGSDYTDLLDRKYATKSYSNQNVNAIISDLISTYAAGLGITTNNVNCGITVANISFDYKPLSECLEELADITAYDFYIDENKDVHFFARELNPAPFNITDSNGNIIKNSLVFREEGSQITNSIFVRGGEEKSNAFPDSDKEKLVADGQQRTFLYQYKYSNVSVYISTDGGTNWTQKTLGIDYIDDPASYDCLYNFNEKAIKFRENNKPANGHIVRIGGNPWVPIIIQAREPNSISQYGERQIRIVDKSINSREMARDRAKAELNSHTEKIVSGSFETLTSGLRAGQLININSSIFGVDYDYVVMRVSISMITHNKFKYSVEFHNSKEYDLTDYLQRILSLEGKIASVSENEIIDLFYPVDEQITMSEVLSASLFTPPYKWSDDAGATPGKGKWNIASYG